MQFQKIRVRIPCISSTTYLAKPFESKSIPFFELLSVVASWY
jgi:hypothetical protein